jgi:hypothetical protein
MLTLRRTLQRSDLARFPVPVAPPWSAANSRWTPIPHARLADAVVRGAARHGLGVGREAWDVLGGGHTLLGCIVFEPLADWPAGIVPSIALRHSNAGRHALGLAIGAQVLICSNGLLLGDHVLSHRHLPGLDLDTLADELFAAFETGRNNVPNWVDELKSRQVTPKEQDQIMLHAARSGVVSWSLLKHVDQARNEPRCEEFGRTTAWALYNAFTEALKNRAPHAQWRTLAQLPSLFDQVQPCERAA